MSPRQQHLAGQTLPQQPHHDTTTTTPAAPKPPPHHLPALHGMPHALQPAAPTPVTRAAQIAYDD